MEKGSQLPAGENRVRIEKFSLLFKDGYDKISKLLEFTATQAGVSEWQTMQTQNLLRVTACGFKSRRRHYTLGREKP